MAAYDFAATRLFVAEALGAGGALAIRDERANFLLNVLRLRDGEWRATLTGTAKRATTLQLGERVRAQTPMPDLEYLFAPLKHARLDYLVQKAVEMGVGRLRPVLTRRTQVTRINIERMRANAIEAAEQCGILGIPQVLAPEPLEQVLAGWDATRRLVMCDEDAALSDPVEALRAIARDGDAGEPRPLALLIGPEGGFDPGERAMLARQHAVLRVSLGPRILRADTAAVAGLALLQAVLGDWRADADIIPPDTISPR